GNILGNLSDALLAIWQTGAFNNGGPNDLDADTDLDIGGTNTTNAGPHMIGIAASAQDGTDASWNSSNFHVLANGREFQLSTLTFTVTGLAGAGNGIFVNYSAPTLASALVEASRASYNADA